MKITMMRRMRRVLRLISKCLCCNGVLWTPIVIHSVVASRYGDAETIPVLAICTCLRCRAV